jgi:hypothetical protein
MGGRGKTVQQVVASRQNIRRAIAKNRESGKWCDLVGQTFGLWTVLQKVERRRRHENRIWLCRCRCGVEKRLSTYQLRQGLSLSCRSCHHRQGRPEIRLKPYEALYNRAAMEAERNGHTFTLTYDEFLELIGRLRCHYCFQAVPSAPYNLKKFGGGSHLDRQNNALGYTSDNAVLCCTRCNFAKGDRYTYEEWWAMTAVFREGRKLHLVEVA